MGYGVIRLNEPDLVKGKLLEPKDEDRRGLIQLREEMVTKALQDRPDLKPWVYLEKDLGDDLPNVDEYDPDGSDDVLKWGKFLHAYEKIVSFGRPSQDWY